MSKFEARISVALNPDSVTVLAKSIQEALKGQTITLDGINITASNVDVSGIVNSFKKQLQSELKNVNINTKIGGNISVGDNVISGARTSSRTNNKISAKTNTTGTGRKHSSPTDVDVGEVTSRKINVIKSEDRKQAEVILNKKNEKLNTLNIRRANLEENKRRRAQDGLSNERIKEFDDAIRSDQEIIAKTEKELADLENQYMDVQERLISQREKNTKIRERKSAKRTVDNARKSIPELQEELSAMEKKSRDLQKKIDAENNKNSTASYQSRKSDINAKIKEKEELLPDVRRRVSEQNAYIGELNKEKSAISAIARDENKYRRWISDISGQIKQKKNDISDLTDSETRLKSEITELKEEGAAIQAIIGSGERIRGVKSYMRRYADISATTRKKEQELNDIPKKIKDIEKEISAFERTKGDLQKQIDINRNGQSANALRSRYADITSQTKEETARLSDIQKQESDLQGEIADLYKQRSEIQRNMQDESDTSQLELYKKQKAAVDADIKKTKAIITEMQKDASAKKEKFNIKGKAEDEQLFSVQQENNESSRSEKTTSNWRQALAEKQRQNKQARQATKALDSYDNALHELESKKQLFVESADFHSSQIKKLQKELYGLDKNSETYADAAKETRALIKSREELRDSNLENIKSLNRQINQLKIRKASGAFDASVTETTSTTTASKRNLPQQESVSQQKMRGRSLTKQSDITNEQQNAFVQQTQTTEKQLKSDKKTKREADKKADVAKGSQTATSTSNGPNNRSNTDYQKKAADYLTRIYTQQSKNGKIQSDGTKKNTEALERFIPTLEVIKNGEPGEAKWLQKDDESELKRLLSFGKSGTAKLRLKSITGTQYGNLEEGYNKLRNSVYYKKHKTEVDKAAAYNSPDMTPEQYKEALSNLAHFNAEQVRLNQGGKSFLTRLKEQYDNFLKYTVVAEAFMGVRQVMQEMVASVKEVDAAMTELRKVTDLSESGYEIAMERAKETATEVGASVSDTINATADFARLGYSADDAADLAKVALVYKNVGDGIENISQASESIISTMQAFGIEAKDAMSVVDKFNKVGNEFAISSTGIGTAMEKSAAALSAGGNTVDESVAMIAAANKVVQNPEVVGTALKTYSMYLRAAKTEAEEAGEETDGMANSVSELRDELLLLTGGKVDIMENDTTFKSTYEITKELADVWKDLADVDRANILELIGGKRNANTISGLIENFADAEKALEASLNSAGSAMQENEKFLDSIAGKTEKLKATFQDLSTSFLDSDLFKFLLDVGNSALGVIDALIDKIGGLATAVVGVGIASAVSRIATTVKDLGGIKNAIDSIHDIGDVGAILDLSFSGVSAAAVGIGAVVATVGVAAQTIKNINSNIAKQQAEAADAAKEFQQTVDSLDDYQEKIVAIREELSTPGLSDDMAQSKRAELVEIENQLAEAFGREAANIDLINGSLSSQIAIIDSLKEKSFTEFKNENRTAIDRAENYLADISGLGVWDKMFGSLNNYLTGNIMGVPSLVAGDDFQGRVFDEFEKRYGKSIFSLGSSQSFGASASYGVHVKNAYEMQEYLEGLLDITEELGKEEYGGRYKDKVGSALNEYSDMLNDVQDVIEKNEEIFDTYAQGELATNKEYKSKWSELLSARKEYDDAILNGNEDQQVKLYKKILQLQKDFGVSEITDKSVSGYLSKVFDEFKKHEVEIGAKIDIKDDLNNATSRLNKTVNSSLKYFLDANGVIDESLIAHGKTLFGIGSASEAANAYGQLTEAAKEYGLEVEQLISILTQFDIIHESAINSAYKNARNEFTDITKNLRDAYTDSGFSSLIPHVYNLISESDLPDIQQAPQYKKVLDSIGGVRSNFQMVGKLSGFLKDLSSGVVTSKEISETSTIEKISDWVAEKTKQAGEKTISAIDSFGEKIEEFNEKPPTVGEVGQWVQDKAKWFADNALESVEDFNNKTPTVGEVIGWIGNKAKSIAEKLFHPKYDPLSSEYKNIIDTTDDIQSKLRLTGRISDFIKKLPSGLPVVEGSSKIPTVKEIADWVGEKAKSLGEKTISTINSFGEKIKEFNEKSPTVGEVGQWVQDKAKLFADNALEAVESFNNKMPTVGEAISWIGEKVKPVGEKLRSLFGISDLQEDQQNGPTLRMRLSEFAKGLSSGFVVSEKSSKVEDDSNKASKAIDGIGESAKTASELLYDLGNGNLLTLQQIEEFAASAGKTIDEFVQTERIENNITRLKNVFAELANTVDISSGEINQSFLDNMGNTVSLVTDALDSFTAQAEGVATANETINAAIAEQESIGSITADTYAKLTALGSEYSNILEWNGRAIVVNSDAVDDMNSKLQALTGLESEAVQEKSIEIWQRYAEIIGQMSSNYSNLSDSEKESLDYMIARNRELMTSITGYQLLMSQMDFANSGYKKWLDAGSKTDTDKMYSDAVNAYQATQEVFGYTDKSSGKWVEGNKKINSIKFNAATEFLVPEYVRKQGLPAVQTYLKGIQKYLQDDQSSVEEFLEAAKGAKLMEEKDGVWSVKEGVTSDQFRKELNITNDLFTSLVGDANVYGVEFKFDDENQILALNDAQDYFEAQNEYNKAVEKYNKAVKNNTTTDEATGKQVVKQTKEVLEAEKELQDAENKMNDKFLEVTDYHDATLKNIGVKFEEGVSREEAVQKWLNGGNGTKKQLEIKVALASIRKKNDVEKMIQQYRESYANMLEDPGNLEAANNVQQIADKLESLPKQVQVAFGVDTTLFDSGIASISETINDLISATDEYQLNVETGATEEELDGLKGKVNDIVTALNGLPTDKLIEIGFTGDVLNEDGKIDTDKLLAGIQGGTVDLSKLNLNVSLGDTTGLDGTLQTLEQIQAKVQEIQGMDNLVIAADVLIDNAMERLNEISEKLKEIANLVIEPRVELNAQGALSSFAEIEQNINLIVGSVHNVIITASTETAQMELFGIISLLGQVEGDHPLTVSADTSQAVSAINSVQFALDSLRDKTVTVTVNTVEKGATKVNGSAFVGGSWGVKHGGISLMGELGRKILRPRTVMCVINHLFNCWETLKLYSLQREYEIWLDVNAAKAEKRI